MEPMVLFGIQFTLSLLAYLFIAFWYVAPRLSRLPREVALVPLLWVHAFRVVGGTILAPGAVGPGVPTEFRTMIGYGDLITACLALLALTPMADSSALAQVPAATRAAVSRAEARSSTSRASVKPYFCMPARSAWPGRGWVSGFLVAPGAGVGTLDTANAIVQSVRFSVFTYALGVNWVIVTIYVPALLVSSLLIVIQLLGRSRDPNPASGQHLGG